MTLSDLEMTFMGPACQPDQFGGVALGLSLKYFDVRENGQRISERRKGTDKHQEQASATQVWKERRAVKFGKDS